MPADKTEPKVERKPVALSVTQNGRIVVLCTDHTIWMRILDPQNMQGGEKFIWTHVPGPPVS